MSSDVPSPHEVLGVDPDAPLADVRAAYLRRAREVHPDVVADADEATRAASEEQMRRLNDAWSQLSSPETRSTAAASFTVGDDVVAEEPIDLDDEPLGPPPSTLARAVTAAGPLVLVLSVVTIGFGLLFLAAPLLVAGFIGVVVALAAFLMAPLLTMSSARHNR